MPSLASAASTLALLAEPTRVRLLALLARHELAVADLVAITNLGQSRISTHLGRLREAGLVRDRREGTSTYYALNEAMPAAASKVWTLLAGDLEDPVVAADRRRCDSLLADRDAEHRWPDALAGQMERRYSPGRTWESLTRGLLGLLTLGDVLDGGAGDGAVAQLLAPRARSVTCFDVSPRMVRAASERLAPLPHVRCAVGDLHDLPFADASFDAVLLYHVLPHLRAPARALAEAARVLRPRGLLALTTVGRHEYTSVTAAYHHLHPGFDPATVRRFLRRAGLQVEQCLVTSRERRAPHFEVVTAFARRTA